MRSGSDNVIVDSFKIKYKPLSVFYRTLVILILVMIIPMVMAVSIISRSVISAIEQQSYTSNINLLQKTSKVVDTIMLHTDQVLQQVCNDPDIIHMVVAPEDNGMEMYGDTIAALRKIQLLNEYIHSVYLYRAYDDLIISSDGEVSTGDEFFDIGWRIPFRQIFVGTRQMKRRTIQEPSETANCITLIRNIPYSSWSKIGGIIVNLDADKLYDLIALSHDDPGEIFVLDRDGDFLLKRKSINESFNRYLAFNSLMKFNTGYQAVYSGDEEKLIAYISSTLNYWRYVYVVPLIELQRAVKSISLLMYVVMIVYIFFALGVSFLVSNGLYRPVKKLLNTLQIGELGTMPGTGNEFDLIDTAYKDVINRNVVMKEDFKKIEPFIREHFFLDLIKKQIFAPGEIQQKMDILNVSFEYRNFIAVIAEVDDYKSYIQSVDEQDVKVQMAYLIDLLNDLVASYYSGLCFGLTENKVVIIFNLNQRSLSAMIQQEMYDFVMETNKRISHEFPFSLTFGIGEIHVDVENIWRSFHEAEKALNHKLFVGRNQTIFFSDIAEEINGIRYHFYEKNIALMNLLSTGTIEGVNSIIDEIMEMPSTTLMSYTDFLREIGTMLHLFTGFLVKRGIPVDKVFDGRKSPFAELEGMETIDDIRIWVKGICAKAAEEVCRGRDTKVDKYSSMMVEFIKDNFHDDITLYDLSVHVGLSTAYTSKIFKDTVGSNFTEYVSTLRIDEAKQLLSENKLSIKEIAYKVGFNSIYTFLRTFKKFENISPGQYRSIL